MVLYWHGVGALLAAPSKVICYVCQRTTTRLRAQRAAPLRKAATEIAECDSGEAEEEIVVRRIPTNLETVGVFGIFRICEGDGVLGFVAFFIEPLAEERVHEGFGLRAAELDVTAAAIILAGIQGG